MHKFSPQNFEKLENADRYSRLPPEDTLRKLGLRPGMTMVDVGAGTGYFARAGSQIVGPNGRVFAADISAEMLELLRQRGVPGNMAVLQSGEYTTGVPDGTADFILSAFVLHEVVDKEKFLTEIRRMARPGKSKLAVVEWKKQQEERGPEEKERLPVEEARLLLRQFGEPEEGELNSSHYYLVVSL